MVHSPESACIFVFVSRTEDTSFSGLSYWQGDGRNHIILNLVDQSISSEHTGRAVLAQRSFDRVRFRERFDVILPEMVSETQPVWKQYPYMVPITRKYLLSFSGELKRDESKPGGDKLADTIVDSLRSMKNGQTKDKFMFSFSCDSRSFEVPVSDWYLCEDKAKRFESLEKSTFALILVPSNPSLLSTRAFQTRLQESLRAGSIPVILGTSPVLPFSEFLDWSRFSIRLPRSRITELHYLLRTFTYSDLFNFKRQETFFEILEF